MSAEFYGHGYQCSSEPLNIIDALESDIWPVADNSGSGTKDAIGDGLHPVVALGGRTAADGRPLNLTGVVISFTAGLTIATGRVRINIADGACVVNYVANVLTYANNVPATFEQTPVPFQPVYVDDSNDLQEGVTLSMSPLNDTDVANPLAGHLYYCQDELPDAAYGGARTAATFDTSLANELVEQAYCIILSNGWRELASSWA